jgi:RNA ligase (TIGR02306 family)
MRKLVTIRKINDLSPILGADNIEVASIDGWKVVVKKGEFKVGDPCVYFEIDSFLPESDPRYAFIMKSGVREFEGIRGHKLRTVKLRGQISQGLALPLGQANNTMFPEIWQYLRDHHFDENNPYEADFSALLGIKKWEPQLPAELAGQIKGVFPSFIRKTDQERCQNLIDEIFIDNADSKYEVTIKLDGTSATFYHHDGYTGACSRNFEMKICDENATNTYVRILIESGLQTALPKFGNIAVQGEIMGPGIQGNREKLKTAKFFIFDVYLIDESRYMTPVERKNFVNVLLPQLNAELVSHVPVIAEAANLRDTLGITNIEQLLQFAAGKSLVHPVREGLVFKRDDGNFSFKAINNEFLAKEKD